MIDRWPHQVTDTQALLDHPAYALFLEPGLGKSRIVIDAAAEMYREGQINKVIVVGPASARSVWVDPDPTLGEVAKWHPRDGDFSVQEYHVRDSLPRISGELQWVVTNPEFLRNLDRLHPLKAWAAARGGTLLVIDECFVAGTPVQTASGPRPIEDIRPGSVVFSAHGPDLVIGSSSRDVTRLIRVETSASVLVCSENHPFLTQEGWVAAGDLEAHHELLRQKEALSILRGRVLDEPEPSQYEVPGYLREAQVLQRVLQAEWHPSLDGWDAAHPGAHREHPSRVQEQHGQAGESTRQRAPDGASTQTEEGSWGRLGVRVPGQDSRGAGTSRSVLLQSRHRAPRETDCDRDRSIVHKATSPRGPQEASRAERPRVVRVSRHEQGDSLFDHFSRGAATVRCYDLTVQHHPSFALADGTLVHNSWQVQSPTAKQTKRLYALRQVCDRVTLLNGTPGEPKHLYSQFKILDDRILACKNYFQFRGRFCVMGGWGGKQIVDYQRMDEFRERTAPYAVYRATRDTLDLGAPPNRTQIEARLSPANWKTYRHLRDELIAWLESGECAVASNAAVKIMRLAQVTNGLVGGLDGEVDRITEIGREKLDALQSWLQQHWTDPKLLVFTRFRADVERAAAMLQHQFPAHEVVTLYGGQGQEDRTHAKRLLAPSGDPRKAIVVANTQSGGAGLNFAAAQLCVFLANDYRLLTRTQAEGRVDRPGQTGHVTYLDVLATGPKDQRTVDHVILSALRSKQNLADFTADTWREQLT